MRAGASGAGRPIPGERLGIISREYDDWFAVSKPKSWRPPEGTLAGESLLGAGGASLELFAPDREGEAGASAGGGHTKIGAGRKPQPYDEHGRYTGPGGGSVSLRTGEIRMHMTDESGAEDTDEDTGVGEDATAGSSDNGEDGLELTDILLADSGRGDADEGGGLSGGAEVRGKVIPPPPPAPEEPHLKYSQSSGELKGLDGKPLATGYAGRGGGLNNPDAEGIKGVGPLPQGNWRVEEVDKEACKKKGWPEPAYKLSPDQETRKRVEELGRDPDSFYVHAKAKDPKDQGRESWGCIALDKPERRALGPYAGRWIRVER